MLRASRAALFSTTKQTDKPKLNNLIEAIKYAKDMKPYIIPFVHKDKEIRHSLLKSYGLLGLSKLCFFGGPFLLKLGVNSLAAPSGLLSPLLYFFGFGVCYTGSVLFEQMRNLQTLKLINTALIETTSRAYKHMLSLGPQFYFSGSQRHILFNLYKAQTAFQQNLKLFTQYFIPITLDIGLSIALLLYYSNPLFALSFAGCFAAYAVFTVKYSAYRQKLIRKFRQAEKHVDFVTSETFGNYFNVKYFQQEDAELKKYQQSLIQYYDKNYEVQRTLGILNTAQRGIFGTGLTFNMMLAAYYTQLGLLTTGDIIMIQSLMLQFLSPLFFLGTMYRNFNEFMIDIKKITDIMVTPASITEGQKDIGEVKGKIQFKDVNFRYIRDSSNIIEGLNFTVEPGKFVAIVGRSGAGKTSILNLIYRLYDPHTGDIELDGVNLKELTFTFRNHVSFVSQSPYLFNGTVMENLKYGSPLTSDEEIINLTTRLHLHEIIMQLPHQYETKVGEKGNIFSGGEKQRISLIRALLRKSKILLLDEPTSSLDVVTEAIVGQILSELQGVTRIVVTHREGILNFCDEVIKVN